MLIPDLIFNFIALLLVVGACGLIHALARRSAPGWVLTGVAMAAACAVAAAGAILARAMSLRMFAALRFWGMGLFWHAPAALIAAAWLAKAPRRIRFLSGFAAASLGALYLYAYFIEPRRLEITEYAAEIPALAGLSRPLLIAQITDIQTDRVGPFERRVLREAAARKPDMILFNGDYIQTADDDPADDPIQRAELGRLIREELPPPPLGAYAIQGDTDLVANWGAMFDGSHVHAISDQTVRITAPGGVPIQIIGLSVDHSRAPRRGGLNRPSGRFLVPKNPNVFTIYVGHAPDYVEALEGVKWPFLATAGHIHGGQVRLPFIGALITISRLPRKYADYFGPYAGGWLSVARGVGMERRDAPRLRFNCRPELRFITLKPPAGGLTSSSTE